MENNEFLNAMRFRFACKKFDNTKQIPVEKFDNILESARLTPSSFGLEPTRILVVKSKDLREKLKPLCWNQSQITDASELVILTSKVDISAESNYVFKSFSRKTGKNPDLIQAYKERFGGFLKENNYLDSTSVYHCSSKQAYLSASSMMNAAAYLKIDSCAIEGFDKKEVEKLLGLDTFAWQVALLICFGYRIENPKYKSPRLESIVKYI